MTYLNYDAEGYIAGISMGSGQQEISRELYDEILASIEAGPAAPSGYRYRLKADLTWELCEAYPDEATEADFTEALSRLGVTV